MVPRKTKGERLNHTFPTEKSIFDFLGMQFKKPTERKSGRDAILKSSNFIISGESKKPQNISLKKSTKKKTLTLRVPKSLKNKLLKNKAKKQLLKKWNELQQNGITVVSSFSEKDICEMMDYILKYYNEQPIVSDNVLIF